LRVAENNPPTFSPGQQREFVAITGDTLPISFAIEDADACDDYTFSVTYDTLTDPAPPGSLDSLAGVYYYFATAADTGTFLFSMLVSEAPYADTIDVTVYHYTTATCGDCNHDAAVNILDLTWLVAYLFGGGLSPIPLLAGDVDCSVDVNIVDLTYTVAYLFGGGPGPCAGCL
jgi:hypothetical protein